MIEKRKTPARPALIVVLVLILLAGAFLVARSTGPFAEYCTADGLIVETPTGWYLRRDRANNCEWTMFNEQGDRAPEELYDGLRIESPPLIGLNPVRILGVVAVAGATAGIVIVKRRGGGTARLDDSVAGN